MKNKIGIEGGLSNIRQELQNAGYEVADLDARNIQDVKAVVVSGEDNNMMNMADIKTKAQVINARGLSANEVKNQLNNRLS